MSVDTTPVLRIIRLVAKEFAQVSDDDVTAWVELTAPLIGQRVFKHLFNQALALLTAHRMKMADAGTQPGDDPMAEVGNISMGNFMRVGSYKEGQVSIGFNHNLGQYGITDAELLMTEYGIQFKTLRDMMVYPIVSAAESHRGGSYHAQGSNRQAYPGRQALF